MAKFRLWNLADFFGSKTMLKNSFLIWLVVLAFGNMGATLFALANDGHGIVDFAGFPNIFAIKTLWLTQSENYALIAGYSEMGRKIYYYLLGLDFLVPVTGFLFFISGFSYFYVNQRISTNLFILLSTLPPLFIAADYLENISILLMMCHFPDKKPFYSYLVTLGITFKFAISVFCCTILILLFLIRQLDQKPKHR